MLRGKALGRQPRPWLWALAVVAGLGVRVALLPHKGTRDMDTYLLWGHDVASRGLADAYHGIYFPLQYEAFRGAVGMAGALGVSGVTALKTGNLAFDLGSFGVLAVLLGRLGLPRVYALLYWLHPFFLAIFWLGYVDTQLGFLLLLMLLGLAYATRPVHYVVAGVPLALAVVMKPQADMFILMIVVVSGAALFAHRLLLPSGARELVRRAPLLLVAPALVFAGCSALLATGGRSLTYLAQTNLPGELARVSPSLNDNAPNIWYPVADHYRHAGEPIYAVVDPKIFNAVGTSLTLLLLVGGAMLVLRQASLTLGCRALAVFAVASIVGPMTLTHVHENHLFYGAILAVAMIPLVGARSFTVAVHGLLALHFINLAGRYGLGVNSLSGSEPVRSLVAAYGSGPPRLVVAWSAIACYVLFLVAFVDWAWTRSRVRPSDHAEAAALGDPVASGVS